VTDPTVASLMPGQARFSCGPCRKRLAKLVGAIMLKTKIAAIKAQKNALKATFEGKLRLMPEIKDALRDYREELAGRVSRVKISSIRVRKSEI
jgi:hypothetical protein